MEKSLYKKKNGQYKKVSTWKTNQIIEKRARLPVYKGSLLLWTQNIDHKLLKPVYKITMWLNPPKLLHLEILITKKIAHFIDTT